MRPHQEEAFSNMKDLLTTFLKLVKFEMEKKHSLRPALLQKEVIDWLPVSYASSTTPETKQRYAQTDKEALAVTWLAKSLISF